MYLDYNVILIIKIASCLGQHYAFRSDSASANMMCSAEKVQFSMTSVNDISCVRACSLTQNCQAVIFYYGNKTCFGLNTDDPFNVSILLSGAVFYKLTIAMSQRSARPSTTTAPTTAKAPTKATTAPSITTTIAPPTGKTAQPTTTTAPPTATTAPQTTTTAPPTTTAAPTTVTSAQPTTTTSPPTVTTAPQTTTTAPLTVTAAPTTTITSAVIPGCVSPFAMVEPVEDSQLSASSVYASDRLPDMARLSDYSYWASQASQAVGEYIQVDFLNTRVATAVITQGVGSAFSWTQYVTSYTVSTSIDCVTFSAILDIDGAEQVFPGNTDKVSLVTNNFVPPVSVRCLKIIPQTWITLIAMRFEVMGCIP